MPSDGHTDELIGYTDPWSVHPGGRIRLMVSSSHDEYAVSLARLGSGDDLPGGPGFKLTEVPEFRRQTRRGRVQHAKMGSCAVVESAQRLSADRFSVQVWLWSAEFVDREQGVLSAFQRDGQGWGLLLDSQGHPILRARHAGETWELRAPAPLRPRSWSFLCATISNPDRRVALHVACRRPLEQIRVETLRSRLRFPLYTGALLLMGAIEPSDDATATWALGHFNGKIDSPSFLGTVLTHDQVASLVAGTPPKDIAPHGVLASWDFSRALQSATVVDTGPLQLHARLINAPTRAVTGRHWRGAQTLFAHALNEYSAIHFHDDDLEDAGWQPDAEIMLPLDLRSGVYAFHISAGDVEDHVPFFVRPRPEADPSPLAVLLPTYTYLAYANGRSHFRNDVRGNLDPLDHLLDRHPEWGLSTYDQHADGSGCSTSSRLRPIPNLRPRYRNWYTGTRRHFGADLYIIDWLDQEELAYDILTDEDLHREGSKLLSAYKVVLTGSHPEYCTGRMLDALESYLSQGGRLVYLGGNGFYWVAAPRDEGAHLIEIRRGHSGTSTWRSLPGEEFHATGERGGLWRNRGRPPNRITGVGFTAQGVGTPAPGYRRTKTSYDPKFSWVFDGVAGSVIGDFGRILDGAAGDEIDRYDDHQDTPSTAVVLASADDYPGGYTAAVDDMLMLAPGDCASSHPNVRADLVIVPLPNGGAVFSVSSMTWVGALPCNKYDNNVSRVTANVIRRFLDPAPLLA